MAPRRRELPSDRNAAQIVKVLDPITSVGIMQDTVFEDWLEVVEACLDSLPYHVGAALRGQPLTDTPATQALFKRLHQRYDQKGSDRTWVYDAFAKAMAILLDAAYEDG